MHKIILTILALIACVALFAWGTWNAITIFHETSYKVVAVFLSMILLSNICAKICIHTIQHHGKNI